MKKILFFCAIFTSQSLIAQNVGIGLTTPLVPLHISTGASGNITPFSPLVVEGNNHTYINLLSPNVNETGLLFGKADNAASGAIVYNNVNTLNGFQFRTAGNITQMILNNTGNLGIGVSTPNAKLSISANGTELGGTAMSNSFRTNAGILGNNTGDELSLASIGFTGGGNSISLGIRTYRTSAASSWNSTALLLGYDVDNTVRAGGGLIALSANGNIGIGTINPLQKMHVEGATFLNGDVGIGTPIPSATAVLDVSSTTKGFLPPRMTREQITAISTPAEGLISYNTTTKKPNYYNGTEWRNFDGSFVYTIGDNYQGGIIAYILQAGDPGYNPNVTHGLIAAASDQSTGAIWGCGGSAIPGADGTALGTGNQNTIDIMAGCAAAGIAARICGDLVLNGYSDWYLPSKDELNKLYLNRVAVGGFVSNFYQSSSEGDGWNAWTQDFTDGAQGSYGKIYSYRVRAVRAF